jgi:hypothetical protein
MSSSRIFTYKIKKAQPKIISIPKAKPHSQSRNYKRKKIFPKNCLDRDLNARRYHFATTANHRTFEKTTSYSL